MVQISACTTTKRLYYIPLVRTAQTRCTLRQAVSPDLLRRMMSSKRGTTNVTPGTDDGDETGTKRETERIRTRPAAEKEYAVVHLEISLDTAIGPVQEYARRLQRSLLCDRPEARCDPAMHARIHLDHAVLPVRPSQRRYRERVRRRSVDPKVEEAHEVVLAGAPLELRRNGHFDHVIGERFERRVRVETVEESAAVSGEPGEAVQRRAGPKVVPVR